VRLSRLAGKKKATERERERGDRERREREDEEEEEHGRCNTDVPTLTTNSSTTQLYTFMNIKYDIFV